MQYLGGSEDKTSLATMYSTNFKTEAKALRTEAAHAEHSTNTPSSVIKRQTTQRPIFHPDLLKSKQGHFAVDTFP